MRVALILPGLSVGGTEKMVFHLAKGLRLAGEEPRVWALKGDGPVGGWLRAAQVPVTALGTPEPLVQGLSDLPRIAGRLSSDLAAWRPQVLHSFLTRANLPARWAGRRAGVAKIFSSLRVLEEEKRFHLWAERIASRPPVRFTVNSEALRGFAVRNIGLSPNQIVVIRNGVEPPRPVAAAEVAEVRERWGLAGKPVLLAAGRLHRQKGFDLLIAAMAEIQDRTPAVLLIAGQGEERLALGAEIRRRNLAGRIRLMGPIEDLAPYRQAADLFILSSRWEGTPNVVLESMAAGCPLVCADVGGLREILEAPSEGIVVPAGNLGALAAAILHSLQDELERKRRAQRALLRSREFSMDRMVREHRALYAQ